MRKNIHHATGPNVFVLSASGLTQREEEERGGGLQRCGFRIFVWRRERRRSTAADRMGNSTCVAVLIARQNSETHVAQTTGLQSQ